MFRTALIGLIIGAALSLAATDSQAATCRVPSEHSDMPFASAMLGLTTGCSFNASDADMLFMGGLADHLLSNCSLNLSGSERQRLTGFVVSNAIVGAFGKRYSDPNLIEALGSAASGRQIYAIGGLFAKEIGCQTPVATTMAKNVVKALDGRSGGSSSGPSTFMRTCAPIHGEQSCACLADIASAVHGNVHGSYYDRDLIYGLIQANPFLGFQIGLQCRIVNY